VYAVGAQDARSGEILKPKPHMGRHA